ncbi:MAG: hypothetical protein NTU61_04180, partial [Candidatus Altiarchaeota archaeon]|nr:hypothetical protein [Candidatus Altiarchaeota archaeon]
MSEFMSELTLLEVVLILVLVIGILFMLYLILAILSSILRKRRAPSGDQIAVVEQGEEAPAAGSSGLEASAQQEPEPERPLTEKERLSKKEEELRKREDIVKEQRRGELEQREKMISGRTKEPELAEQHPAAESDELSKTTE